MVYSNFHSLVYKTVSICQWKICIFAALLGFQAARMISPISLQRQTVGSKKINLWVKLKLVTQIFKQLVGKDPFCIVTEGPRNFVCHCTLNTRNVTWRNPKTSVLCKFPYTFCNIITKNRMHASYIEVYANAVLLSVKIWTYLKLQLCLKYDFTANKMAFSSRIIIWFLYKEFHLPLTAAFPSIAPHPCSLDPVWIVQSTGTSYNVWFAFLRCLNHQQ